MLASQLIEELIWAVEKVGNVGILIQKGETLSLKVETLEDADLIVITTKTEEEQKLDKEREKCIVCSFNLDAAHNGIGHGLPTHNFCSNCGRNLTCD